METVRSRVVVSGRVQGVWFRDSTYREATARQVTGWVRNLTSGEVEAVFEGEPNAVAEMVAWARRGPERALVTSVEVSAEKPVGLVGFELRPTA